MPARLLRYSRRLVTLRCYPEVRRHRVALRHWTGADFRIVVLSDFHVSAPWVSLRDLERIVELANGLKPDLIALAGDFLGEEGLPGRRADAFEIAGRLAELRATAGVFAVLGNHDWQDCALARSSGFRRCSVVEAFAASPVDLLTNEARPAQLGARTLWVVGLDSQHPFPPGSIRGRHDPEAAFAPVPDGAPAILLAHEPGYFARGDDRAGLQISGHTHGGQLNLFGWRPMLPDHADRRFAHGHLREGRRSLVVSGGLGFSGLPMRIGQPPEITVIEVGRETDAT